MHLMDELSLLENDDSEGIHNIIVDILDMIMDIWPVFPPHALCQLEPQLLQKVGAPLQSADGVSWSVDSFHIGPSTELLHIKYFSQP